MNTFEFIAAISVILLISIAFAATINQMQNLAQKTTNNFEAKLQAEKCAAIIDSFYANSGGEFKKLDFLCHTQNEKIISEKNNTLKTAGTIAPQKSIVNSTEGTSISVEVQNHYEK